MKLILIPENVDNDLSFTCYDTCNYSITRFCNDEIGLIRNMFSIENIRLDEGSTGNATFKSNSNSFNLKSDGKTYLSNNTGFIEYKEVEDDISYADFPETSKEDDGNGGGLPGFEIILLIVSIGFILFFKRRKKILK